MLVGLFDKVADLLRVRRFDILDRFEDREALLAVDLGQMHGMHDVMTLRIERYCALWPAMAHRCQPFHTVLAESVM